MQPFLPLFFSVLVPPDTAERDSCGSLSVQPCSIVEGHRTRDGFTCDITAGGTCLDRNDWCTVDSYRHDNCNSSANLLFSSCASFKFNIRNRHYLTVMVPVAWMTAEQHCQDLGYNLVDFPEQDDFDDVTARLKEIKDSIQPFRGIEVSDPIGQRCWSPAFKELTSAYWTGVYSDHGSSTWNTTSGRQLNADLRGVNVLQDVMEWPKDGNRAFIVFTDTRRFHRHVEAKDAMTSQSLTNRHKFVCVKEKETYRKYAGAIADENSGCITGFRCAGVGGRCLLGRGYADSHLCDGKADCPNQEDEYDRYCPSISATVELDRTFHFWPKKRMPKDVESFCRKHNWTLPSLRSNNDIAVIKSLPVLFTKSRTSPDFYLTEDRWHALQWIVLLGAKGKQLKWQDGNEVEFGLRNISQISPYADMYLVFNETHHGTLVGIFDHSDLIYTVCESRGKMANYTVIKVPIIIPNFSGSPQPFPGFVPILLSSLLNMVMG